MARNDLIILQRGSQGLRSLLRTPGLVACYLPYLQVAQGTTGQTLIDYSSQGNHAQLGSTPGEDTNDPSWGTNALVTSLGDLDNYVVTPDFGCGNATVFSVYNPAVSEIAGDVNYFCHIFTRNNFSIFHRETYNLYKFSVRKSDGTSSDIGSQPGSTPGSWHLGVTRIDIVNAQYSMALSGVGSMTDMGFTPHETYTGYGRLLMSLAPAPRLTFVGSLACIVLFNRVLSDGEASRVRANIVTLMNGQGVTVE